jgi:Zn-dependent M28 family amino/carboxypeptidase
MRPFTVLIGIVLGSAASWLALASLTTAGAGSFLGQAKWRPRRGGARTRPPWPACVSLAVMLGACAAHKGPPPSTDIDETGFRDAVRVLASDDFEGRKPGTRGEDKTVAFLTAEFRKLGLKPGNGDNYVQQVPLVEIRAGDDATLSVAGPGGARPLRFGKEMVIWTKRVAPAARLQQSELVFVGYGIVAPEYDWNDYAQVDVRGKTVLVLDNDPGYGSNDPTLFRGNATTYYGRWAYKFEEAARQGAAGVLLIHDIRATGFGWNVVTSSWTGAQLDRATTDDNAGRAAIEGWISNEAGRALFTQAGLAYEALSAAAARPGFKAVAMGVKVDAEVHNSIRRLSSANVIALLPGGQRKHEYVLYTAHWDHLGRDSSGVIFNGAVDNATGVAGLLMLAQSFGRTRPPPDRSIVFIAFTAEESGLLGSAYYVENPVFSLRQTAGVLNLDGLHIGGRTRDVVLFGAGNSELEEYVRAAALLQGRETRPEFHPEQGIYFRSDQFNFARHGVPAIYAKAGIDDSARGPAWGQAQLDDYLAHRYRQPSDKYSEDWDVRGAIDDLALYYTVGDRLARTRRFPRWYPNSDFSASRSHGREATGD